jgi:hypothetical protein
VTGIAVAFAVTSTWTREGMQGMVFSPLQAVVITAVFIVPILVLWIERNIEW